MIIGVLERAARRLSAPNSWIQGASASDGRRIVCPCHPSAVSWDLMGAITAECQADPEDIALVLDVFKRTGWGREVTAVVFNDYPERTQDQVVDFLLERAALVRMEERCRP